MGKSTNPVAPVATSSSGDDLISMATAIVSAYVAHNQVPITEVPVLFKSVHSTLTGLAGGSKTSTGMSDDLKPAVPVKKSLGEDFIICLEDGKKLTMLKRYLRTHFNMSPEEYRKKWGLPHDYPMVAPAYAKKRSAFAKKIGLGTVPNSKRKPKS